MRAFSILLLGTALLAGCATNTTVTSATSIPPVVPKGPFDAYVPPTIGTVFTLNSVSLAEPVKRMQQMVVQTGVDYAVYAVIDSEPSEITDDLFFIEYSGVYWNTCGEDMPDTVERTALANMWPLKEGNSATIETFDFTGEAITVNVQIVSLETQITPNFGEQRVAVVKNDFELPEIGTYSPELKTHIRIDWGEPESGFYDGYDELVSISQADTGQYQRFVDYAQAHCTPA